jgi:hypothetical protein
MSGGARDQPGRGQDPANRAFADPVPEDDEFSLDAPMTPAGVLPRQPKDQVADLVGDSRAPRSGRVGPMPFDQTAVPGQERTGRHDPMTA